MLPEKFNALTTNNNTIEKLNFINLIQIWHKKTKPTLNKLRMGKKLL
ncbi:hypothetical protein SAMN05428642_103435 [Flaviramulus basaltis]|uniref:Uncharacterized protein n=1 Tax=Flaviramulus basaltis TaxID=369401 RepID=A0A1K2INI9_9FLAO|nr:hypothetical protein SAMN05428642_103435 [Flaviramulus basaltis]